MLVVTAEQVQHLNSQTFQSDKPSLIVFKISTVKDRKDYLDIPTGKVYIKYMLGDAWGKLLIMKRAQSIEGLTPQEKKALRDFKRRLKSRFGDILISIKLFGSRARGDFHPGSDIDILVVLEERTKKMEDSLVEIICEILNVYGVYFEVVSYSRREYELSKRRQWPFVLNLEREAILI